LPNTCRPMEGLSCSARDSCFWQHLYDSLRVMAGVKETVPIAVGIATGYGLDGLGIES
jgi:hypothetical protein